LRFGDTGSDVTLVLTSLIQIHSFKAVPLRYEAR
jgi:hypothetical protein